MEQHKKKTYVTPTTEIIIIGEDLLEGGIGPSGSQEIDDPTAKGNNSFWSEEEGDNPWDYSLGSPKAIGGSAFPSSFKKTSLWDD